MIETGLGNFEEVILLLVGIVGEEAAYASRIAEEFELQTGRNVSVAATHTALERLQLKGFVRSEMGVPTSGRGGRRTRIFLTTASGKKMLKRSRAFRMSLWRQFVDFGGS